MPVKVCGTRFVLDGAPFPVVGANCYFLAYCSSAARMPVLHQLRRAGASAVRAWAFLDLPERPPSGHPVFQYADSGEIRCDDGPDGLERLDQAIADAEASQMRLILPLVNHWKDFGGAPQYLQWLGISGPVDEFYRDPRARDAYRRWVERLLTRTNTRTGRLYRDEPAVLAWELANEPRCEKLGRRALLDWAAEMSAFVKSLDSVHLLAVGDEGHFGRYGVDARKLLALPAVDYGTFHLYPASLRRSLESVSRSIERHLAAGKRASKPILLEEYGAKLDARYVRDSAERDRWYSRWLTSVLSGGGAGDLFWMIGSTHPEVAGFRDPYVIDSLDTLPSFAAHAAAMRDAARLEATIET